MNSPEAGDPRLEVLGSVQLTGARGNKPLRSARQCLEYCGWLLRFPGRSAITMGRALLVAEGTRRSNVSRLRLWLGTDDNGEPYLPEAYTGRIKLSPKVSSDWEYAQILLMDGIKEASENRLTTVLNMVRGAPIADSAPGQWHWADEWRCEMMSMIRDVGIALCGKALARGDIDLARWAVSRAMIAVPGDDRLTLCRIRIEHAAGNQPEVERLALQVTRHARLLGLDLPIETVSLLHEALGEN